MSDPSRCATDVRSLLVLMARLIMAPLCLAMLLVSAAPRAHSGAAPLARPIAEDVFVYRSSTTQAFFNSIGAEYSLFLDAWHDAAPRLGIAWQETTLAQLDKLPARSILVLASTVALDEAERAAVDRFVGRGGALLATWATGARGNDSEWLGYDFLTKYFGVEIKSEFAPEAVDWFLLPDGETPITTALPAALRIPLTKVDEHPLRAIAQLGVARYGDWSRQSAAPDLGYDAIAIEERAGSRRAWVGFPETSWSASQSMIDTTLRGILNWLRREPEVAKGAWPAEYEAAILLEMDAEQGFGNSELFARHLEDHGMAGTFYCLTAVMTQFPDVVRGLEKRHEMAYHGDVHDGFKGQPLREQEARMARMIAAANTVLADGSKSIGFRAPFELSDRATEIAARRAGLKYFAADGNAFEYALPGFSDAETTLANEDRLILLPRAWLDDMNLIDSKATPDTYAQLFKTMVSDTLRMRSFGLLSVHSQNYTVDGPLFRAVPVLLDQINTHRDKLWVATGSDIERWWRNRDRLTYTIERKSSSAVVIQLHVAHPLEKSIRLDLYPPAEDVAPSIGASDVKGLDLVRSNPLQWSLVLPALEPGRYTVNVVFKPTTEAAQLR
jgi:peptidoglycan/xylan/chitin deacetylase (PgdA/CDA1 family)